MTEATKIHDDLYYDERSAGGIVYKLENGKPKWLLIKTYAKKIRLGENNNHKTVFKFPKGHLNKNEVLKAAALREVEEEAKMKCKIVTKIGSNDYVLWDKVTNKKIIKKVTFFLMEYESESDIRYFDNEPVLGKEWFEYEEANKRLAYDSEKILLRKAKNRLEQILKK
ncbi:MAG TPA: NUDIX domain-containing protein [Candidatus Woesebacteria bacterium]|nr:NUDIX domain-containing protein [Candidatus Woesebacteria bacterium]HPJ17405.1 NUDIX domain-containing protein [Candidatus Woesebacteria bacterium]